MNPANGKVPMSVSLSVSAREASEAEILDAVRDVSHAIIVRLMPQVAAEGLAPPTFWHLHYLERSGVKHPGELARRLGITPATCTWSVDQLVTLGYVVRSPSSTDRRQVVLQVTPKGRRTLEAVWQRFDVSLQEVLATLSAKDVAVTARTLRAISTYLRKSPVDGALEARP